MIKDGWMDETPSGEDLRSVLERAGVRGAWLTKLAGEPKLTVDLVRDEWKSIRQDPHVRNPTAVLVSRLRDRLHVQVGRGPMGADMVDALRRFEILKRSRGRGDMA